jgi:hypothetical protein
MLGDRQLWPFIPSSNLLTILAAASEIRRGINLSLKCARWWFIGGNKDAENGENKSVIFCDDRFNSAHSCTRVTVNLKDSS